ncbi:hypothetical protein AB0442_34340 [Kitasatospora sp. NPDC085895]|uniref:hypothetical protein n=1 Tax=Kitasatospora sp. NPDC085895 TaxID=3155057 RepID=UPI00344BDDD7
MTRPTEPDRPLGTHTAYQLADAVHLFAYAMEHHRGYPGLDDPDLGEIADVLRRSFARPADALEDTAAVAGTRDEDGPERPDGDPAAEPWNRARHDALNLSDRLAHAVPTGEGHEQEDRPIGEVCDRFLDLRKARFRTLPD